MRRSHAGRLKKSHRTETVAGHSGTVAVREGPDYASVRDPDKLREFAWRIAVARPQDQFVPTANYVTLAMAGPRQGLVTWRVLPEWVATAGRHRGDVWQQRRLVLRLYDVTLIDFNGFNAHRILDITLDELAGERLFGLDAAGRTQLAEVGFLLPSGEFMPTARSLPVQFPSGSVAPEYDPSALFVDSELRPEPVPTPWEASHFLKRREAAELRGQLRIAFCSFESAGIGHRGSSAVFVAEVTRELCRRGHEVHVVLPRCDALLDSRLVDGVEYHPVDLADPHDPIESSQAFGRSARQRLGSLGRFDLYHAHEWMSGAVLGVDGVPGVLSLTSTERIRIGSNGPTETSRRIQHAERLVAQAANYVFVSESMRSRALAELQLSEERLIVLPLEGRVLDEWGSPLDLGQVRSGLGLGPLDRIFLFVGPIEWGAGPDLMVEALPALLGRHPNCRMVFVGLGGLQGQLEHRASLLGVGHAVRWLGHLDGQPLVRVLRAAEALVLPSRRRESFDEGVVALARRAGRPVVTTHSGPSHLVAHEQNGLVTYDNPGSIVWAIGHLLDDVQRADLLGALGRFIQDRRPEWSELADGYCELCAELFPELAKAPN